MSKFIIDEDGQVFHSPISLDEFSYYRDYILVRTFKEFFELNPQANESGWVDYSGPDYWDAGTYNDGYWEGNQYIFGPEYMDVALTPQKKTWPDGEKPWNRYFSPSHIRITLTDEYGVPKDGRVDIGGYGDSEWMESLLTGNVLDGHVLWYNATIPLSGETNDYITSIQTSTYNTVIGDRLAKVEFKFERLADWNALDFFRDTSGSTFERPNNLQYTPGASGGGAPTVSLTQSSPNEIHCSIWNGSVWNTYDLGISTYYAPYHQVAHDKFGVIHIFVPFTDPIPPYPTGYVYDTYRYDWTLAGGLVGPFSMHPTEQLNVLRENSYQVIYDSNGYTHFYYSTTERNGAEAPETPWRMRHYYQDASGWHNELMLYIGNHPDRVFSTLNDPAEAYIDSYGRSHFFEIVRDSTLGNYGIGYVHNRDGDWKNEIIYPFTGSSPIFFRAWIVGNQQYILTFDNHLTNGGLVFYQKAWSETNWTKTWILAEGETAEQSRKKYRDMAKILISEDGLFAHLLFTGTASIWNARSWEYYKLNILTLEFEQEYVFGYPSPIYYADQLENDLMDVLADIKNGIPVIFSTADSIYNGFVETLISE